MSEDFKQWVLAKIKGLSDYHPPLDNRDEEHEIYGWMHVLCHDHESINTFVRLHDEGYRRNKEEVAALLTEVAALRKLYDEVKKTPQSFSLPAGIVCAFYEVRDFYNALSPASQGQDGPAKEGKDA